MMTRATRALCVCGSAFVLASCGSSGSDTSTSSGMITQTGRVIAYEECAATGPGTAATVVAGATVTVGAASTTTAKDGTYSLQVKAGVPFTMAENEPADYVPLLEEQDTATASYDRGDTQLIPSQTANFLSQLLPKYDSTLGLITFELVKTGACTDLGGATVTATQAGAGALTQYPASCSNPLGPNAYVTDGVFPAAVIYNVTPGTQTVSAQSPKCTQIPFPYADPTTGLTYDGTVETQGGIGTSFVRIFMK